MPWMLERYVEARERFKVRKPKVPDGRSDVTVRESPDELALRVEEVDTSKALIDVNHIEPERCGPPLVDADWYGFFQALYKGIEGKDWEDMCDSCKVMSKAMGQKKLQEDQKAKALWAVKAAKDRREEFYDPARKDNILGRKRDWSCGKHLKDPNVALDKALKCVEDQNLQLARGLVEARQQ